MAEEEDPLDDIDVVPNESEEWTIPRSDVYDDEEKGPHFPVEVAEDRHETWVDLCFPLLSTELQENLRKRFQDGLCYYSDCSGADAPFHALKDIEGKAVPSEDSKGSEGACLRYKRASEASDKDGDAPKLVLTLNGAPEVLISDFTQIRFTGKKQSGFCCYARKEVIFDVGSADVYSVGFECQDRSTCNTLAPKPLLEVPDSEDDENDDENDELGNSTRTLHASIKVIAHDRPGIFLIEHPYRKDTLRTIEKIVAKRLPHYFCHAWVTCSALFGLPMQRRRLFIVGVNTQRLHLLTPMEECSSLIQQMAHEQRKKPLRLWQCILEDSHVAVKAERKLAERAAENAFTEKMMGGVGWAVSHAAHAEVRKNMQKAFGQAPPFPRILQD